MDRSRSVPGVPLLPRVTIPLVDTQAVRELLITISNGGFNAQLAAAVQLATLLELEEGRFRDVVGDPWVGTAGQRAAHSIGRLLACIKERESVYESMCESWLLSRSAPLEKQVAALRLVLACLSCWAFQYPLTEDRCMDLLMEWAGEAGNETPTPKDPPPKDEEALLREARSVYATGLLAIAMTHEDYAGPASSTTLVPLVAKYLRTALLDQDKPGSAQDTPAPESRCVTEPLVAPIDGDTSSTCTASSDRSLCQPVGVLRRLRLQYCAGLLSAVGEYVDALGPVLAERGAEALLELMRRAVAAADGRMLYDTLSACVGLTAHRRFSEQFVEAGGVELALALPRNPHTYSGLAMLLYSLAAAPLAFELLLKAGLPQPLLSQQSQSQSSPALGMVVSGSSGPPGGLAGASAVICTSLSLLSCGQDVARKTCVTFLSSCMHFPATLHEFQAQEGVRRMMNLLRALLTSVRSESPTDLRVERQVGYYAALTLRQFVVTHLVLHVGALKRGLAATAGVGRPGAAGAAGAADRSHMGEDGIGGVGQSQAHVLPYRPVDTSREALDSLMGSLESDRRLAEAFVSCRWPALEHLLDVGAPALLLELVWSLPPERWFHEAALAALETVRLLTLAPLARRAVLAAIMPVGPGGGGAGGQQLQHRSGVGVLLNAATLSTSTFFSSDPQMVAEALSTLVNCLTPPPSLVALLAVATVPGPARGGAGGGGTAALTSTTPARRPERATHASTEPLLITASGGAAALQPDVSARRLLCDEDGKIKLQQQLHNLEGFYPSSHTLSLALEAGYVHARTVVRQLNGIRVLMQLLQPRHGQGPNAVPTAALDRIRALACRALVGLSGDPVIRQILTRLQLARLVSDLVREPIGPGAAWRRPAGVALEPGAPYQRGVGEDWHEAFTAVALELIALTTTGIGPVLQRQGDKLTAAAAANDASAPALMKIERAAIAATSIVSYVPQELLLLVYEHLIASGLHASADALATEANLARVSANLHKLLLLNHKQAPGESNLQPPLPEMLHGNGAGTAGMTHPPPPVVPGSLGAAGLASMVCTPHTGGGGGGSSSTARKGRPIGISAALRDAVAVRSKSELSYDLARLQLPKQEHPDLVQHQDCQQRQLPSQSEDLSATDRAGGGEGDLRFGSGTLKRRASVMLPPMSHPMIRGAAAAAPLPDAPPLTPAKVAHGVSLATTATTATTTAAADCTTTATPAVTGSCTIRSRPSSAHTQPQPRSGGGGGGGSSRKRTSNSYVNSTGAKVVDAAVAVVGGPLGATGRILEVGSAAASASGRAHGTEHLSGPVMAPGARPGEASDADYLTRAFGQQQQYGKQQRLSGTAGTPQFLVRNKALASPFAITTADRPSGLQGPGSGWAAGGTPCGTSIASITTIASAAAAAHPTGSNPLLANLPNRKTSNQHTTNTALTLRRHSSNSTAVAAATCGPNLTATGGCPSVDEPPPHLEAAARELQMLSRPPTMSKLHHIVMSYLRQQHRQAVMQAAVPTGLLPPISLSRPYVMPQATHALDAPLNVTRRVQRRELGGDHGGRGGARADMHLVFSRFRGLRSQRDDGSLSLCAAFINGWRHLVVGTHGGELKLQDSLEGAIVDVVEGHTTAVMQLRAGNDACGSLLLSSARSDVKLWAIRSGGSEQSGDEEALLPRGPRVTWDGVTRASFSPDCVQVVAVSCTSERQAMLFDVRTTARLAVLDPPPLSTAGGGGGGGSRSRTPLNGVGLGIGAGGGQGFGRGLGLGLGGGGGGGADVRRAGRGNVLAAACYGPTGTMLLWGNCLYDLRMHTAVHQFDMFTDSGSGAFHPAGLEVILNSEVWDLRTFKLLRSVPSLDGTCVAFNGTGDIMYVSRRQADAPFSHLFHQRRARHPLHTSFRTIDAATYTDIATVAVERVVLDLAVEPSDSLVAVVAVDLTEDDVTAAARVYEVGRRRPADDESDAEEDAEDDSDGGSEDEDEAIDFGAGSDSDTLGPGMGRRRTTHQAGTGTGGAMAAALRRLAQGGLGGGSEEEEGGEGGSESEEDEEGGVEHRDLPGRVGGGSGDDDDDFDGGGGGGGGGGSDDEEIGLAMLEDAYAALEDAYGVDDDNDGEYDTEEEGGELDDDDVEALLEGHEDDDDDGEDMDQDEDEDESDGS